MGKYGKYKKKYRKEWEIEVEFTGWLIGTEGEEYAHCKVCNINLRAHKADLRKHAQTTHHRQNRCKIQQAQPKLTSLGINVVSDETKVLDLTFAVHIATHSSIRSVDHLNELISKFGKGTKMEDLKLRRTKCSMLIKHVIAPAMLEDTVKDVGDKCFSLIIDESTDVSVMKYLCLCIRYFSESACKLVTSYLGIVEIYSATAENLSNAILQFLGSVNLKITNLIGLGTDGANNLCGANHSVFTILKTHSPRLQLVKCVAHSLHLCTSKAADELPSHLDFIARETYNWFSCSPLRRSIYKNTFALININTNNKFHELVKLSDTRWLARAKVVQTILNQWLELKTHFNMVVEKCYMARTLGEMYKDDQNYLYYAFLSPILNDVNAVNLLFQHDNADIFKVYCEVYHLLLNITRLILKPSFLSDVEQICEKNFNKILAALDNPLSYLSVQTIDFGIMFRESVAKCNLSNEQIINLKDRCKHFLIYLAKQLATRIPVNINLIESSKLLVPHKCLSSINRPKFDDLPLFLLNKDADKTKVETQWRNLLNINWEEQFSKKEVSSEEFWIFVYNFKNAVGEYIFRDIGLFGLSVLSLPLSNAVVERVFSIMNATKTKTRNRLHIKMLDALLQIKTTFHVKGICCNNFVPTRSMIQKFNSNMYDNTKDTSNNEQDYQEMEDTITLFVE